MTLYSTPTTRLHDVSITTDLDAEYRDATLAATVDIVGTRGTDGTYRRHRHALRPGRRAGSHDDRLGGGETRRRPTVGVDAPRSRTPPSGRTRRPNLYTLTFELADPAGDVIHTTRQSVGFREVEVVDGQLRLNGERVLIRGVNRAETDPDTGRHNTRERIEEDVRPDAAVEHQRRAHGALSLRPVPVRRG